jgi:hypothetical protein
MLDGLMGGMLQSMAVDGVRPPGVQLTAQPQQQQQQQQHGVVPGIVQQQPGGLAAGVQLGLMPLPGMMQHGMLQQGLAPGAVQPVMGQPAVMIPLGGGQVLFPGLQVPQAQQQQRDDQAPHAEQQQQRDNDS